MREQPNERKKTGRTISNEIVGWNLWTARPHDDVEEKYARKEYEYSVDSLPRSFKGGQLGSYYHVVHGEDVAEKLEPKINLGKLMEPYNHVCLRLFRNHTSN